MSETTNVVFDTSHGEIELELDGEKAPKTVENFLAYVDDGHYAGTVFHRVIDGFMVQGGGYDEAYEKKATKPPVENEATNGLKNKLGTVAMARTNDPHSATAQWFVNVSDNAFLDHTAPSGNGWGYAVFGKVVRGMDVVEKMKAQKTGAAGPFAKDAPVEPILIKGARRA
jgi:cyclophilin family peptidyl-prolyl cis-trans isomerase